MKVFEDLSFLRQVSREAEAKLNLSSIRKIFKVFGRHYKPHRKILTFSFLFLFATILVEMLIPWPLKLILDYLILKEPLPEQFTVLNPLLQSDPKLLLLILQQQ